MESEVSFSWLTLRGNKNCHSAEGNKENHNLILKEVVTYYSKGESTNAHFPKGLFIQTSEENTILHFFFFFLMYGTSFLIWCLLFWEGQQSSNYLEGTCLAATEWFSLARDVNIYHFCSQYLNYLKW